MILCGRCHKEIRNPTYFVRELGYLCGEHAREHGLSEISIINKEIENLQSQRQKINSESFQAFQNDCEHDWLDTGYGTFTDGKMKLIYRCSKCNLSNNENY